MKSWKSFLKADTLDWLLEEENPGVRAAAFSDLLDYAADAPRVMEARRRELENGLTNKVFAKMQPGGFWGRPEDFYMRSKYHGTVWSFLLLTEMGCAFSDERFLAAAEFLLSHAQRPDTGGFTYAAPHPGPRPAALPCLSGNLVWAMALAGLADDPRLVRAVHWLASNQFLRDGPEDPAPAGMPKKMEKTLFESCWGEHTCMMGVVKALKAMAYWPVERRSPEVERAITAGVDFLLKHRLTFRSRDPEVIAKPEFLHFGFPLLWRTDAIEMLEILFKLGNRDERMRPALAQVLSKQTADGRWLLEQSFNGRMPARVEKDGRASKWVTLRALRVLKVAGEAGLLG